MKKIVAQTIIILILTGLVVNDAKTQQNTIRLSLNDCINRVIEQNYNVKAAVMEKDKTDMVINETYSALYPKINIGGQYTDQLKMPVMLLPGEFFQRPGEFLPITMGVQYNVNAAATLNMILYNQTALTALKLARKVNQLNDLAIEKVKEELAFEVAKLYYMILNTQIQQTLLQDNIAKMQQLRTITNTLVVNGIALQIDIDRIDVNIENISTQLNSVQAGVEQQLNMMKYLLNISLNDNLTLTDDPEIPLINNNPTPISDFSSHIDMRLLDNQRELLTLNKKITNSGYFPTLLFTGQYAFQGMRSEFGNYWRDVPENKWFASAQIGLQLSIPIFDGFEKRSKAAQNQIDILKTEAEMNDKQISFNVNYKVAVNNYNNNKINLNRQQQNIALANKVYAETTLKYQEGMATTSNLLQDKIALHTTQSGYLQALYNFREAELNIMKLDGSLNKMIK